MHKDIEQLGHVDQRAQGGKPPGNTGRFPDGEGHSGNPPQQYGDYW